MNERTPKFNIGKATLEELKTELLILEGDTTPTAKFQYRLILNAIADRESPKVIPQWELDMRARDARISREMFEQRKREGFFK